MPRIHEYVDGRGLYIKARHEGRITTYQVTAKGEQLLRQHGFGPGHEMSGRDVMYMLDQGLIYTGGSGPGILDDDFAVQNPPSRFQQPVSQPRTSGEEDFNWGCLIAVGVVVFLVVLGQCAGGG